MPFTPAHAAITLPFIKLNPRYVSATGLIVGSISPDFEYFFKLTVDGKYAHTFWGLFYFDIPVAIILAFVFHIVAKRNLIINLPNFLQQRLQPLLQLNFTSYFKRHSPVFLISAWFGAASHIIWDAFTHSSGYAVAEFPFLRLTFIPVQGVYYPIYHVLQHVSTAIGITVISLYIILMRPRPESVTHKPSLNYWAVVAVIASGFLLIRFLVKSSDYNVGNLIVTAIAGLCLAIALSGFIYRSDLPARSES